MDTIRGKNIESIIAGTIGTVQDSTVDATYGTVQYIRYIPVTGTYPYRYS